MKITPLSIQHYCTHTIPLLIPGLTALAMTLAIYAVVLLPTLASAEGKIIRILSLGDSITQAEINRASYRYPLWKKLIDAEIAFDFVGSMQTQQDKYSRGTPPQPDYKGRQFDTDHEGHFGWQASDIVRGRNPNNGTGSGNLSQWVQDYDFDIALIHLGTNDLFYNKDKANIAGQLKTIIEILRHDNPEVVVLLAQLIPTSQSDTVADALVNMNGAMHTLIDELDNKKSPILLIDQYTGFIIDTDSYDGTHPNASGEEKMAQRWFEGIQAAITKMK